MVHVVKFWYCMLLVHGCDMTSAVFSHGKGTVFSKLSGNKSISADIDTLQIPAAQSDNVVQAGVHLLIALYGGKQMDTLGSLCYVAYSKMISKSSSRLQPEFPERLPPSERATYKFLCSACTFAGSDLEDFGYSFC